jgi:tetratricopeptide (TPR) repeat protein
VFIDNLFFIDRQSRDFFEFFLKNAEVKPFFLLADRSEHPDILEVFRGVEVVHVPPLDREEATRLLRSVCPECSEEGLEESILENAGGNPLFIREFARFARESQEGSTLPSTIQNIFLTSVDSYSEDMRDLLKKLSVFRVNFTAEDIRYLQSRTDGDPAAVEEALAFYVREGLLIRDHEVYSFKHDVLKKALYGSILNFNKRILHRIIADRMEQTPDPHEIRLLDHLIRAEEFERAEQALSHARNLMVNLDYLPFIDTLLDRLSEDDFARMNELLFAKTALLFNNGNTDEADKVLHKILRIGVSKQAPDYIAMAYHVITAYNLQSYAFHKAMHCGQKALSYYRALGKSLGNQRNVLRLLCLSETLGGHTEESAWLLEEIRALTDPEKPEERYELSLTAAERSAILSDYRAVSGYLRTIEEEELDPGEDYLRARRIYLSIQNSWSRCDFPRLLRAFENPELALERQHSNLSQAHAMRATALHFEGRSERARESLQQAEFFFFQIRNEHDRCDAARTLALCAASIGQTDRARQAALDALSPGLRLSAFYPSLSLLMLLVEQAELAGELEEARFFLYEASHYMPPGPAVARRDRISYHFFNDLLGGVDDTDLQTHVELARDLLREELTQIENTEAFLAQRSYRRIRERLMGVGQAP